MDFIKIENLSAFSSNDFGWYILNGIGLCIGKNSNGYSILFQDGNVWIIPGNLKMFKAL